MTPDVFGKYRLIRLLASGGMGEVFLARQEGPAGFAKPMVVKKILSHLAREPAFVEMFLNEARVAAVLSHPNVVQVFELGQAEDTWFIAMEFIHGRTLRGVHQRLRQQKRSFAPAVLARVASQALNGLHYAHTLRGESGEPLNIVHRDLSPDNVMIGFDGQVKVLDFGIAKAASMTTTTRTGTVKGKFAYMPPEQLVGEPLDARADLYAVGVVLYEALAGARPFVADTEPALVNQILNTKHKPLAERAPSAPPELIAVVEQALAKRRDDRFANARQMARALDEVAVAGKVTDNLAVSDFMHELFGAEAHENPLMLTPSAERSVPLPEGVDVNFTEVASVATQAPRLPPPPSTQRRRARVFVIGGVATLAFMIGIAAMVALHRSDEPPVLPTPASPAPPATAAAAYPAEPTPVAVAPPRVAPPEPAQADAPVDAVPADASGKPNGAKAPVSNGRGRVHLRVNPYAEIFEGEKSFGVTPMGPIDLAVGKHVLTLTNDELKLSRKVNVTVKPGQTVVVRVDLLE